jgi:8-oxo-dGTP pyrophosphatase MutT (NUDIX family)
VSESAHTPHSGSSTTAASETATTSGANAASEAATTSDAKETGHVNRAVIRVAAALIIDDAGRLLLVRKRGTSVFMQPGGKYEPGETGAQTLVRELHEELGLDISTDALEPLGTFIAPAANEAGMLVEAEVFRVTLPHHGPPSGLGAALAEPDEHTRSDPHPGAEIAEMRWVHPEEFDTLAVAPLVTVHMLDLQRSP